MTGRRALCVFGATAALYFACSAQAFADGSAWTAVGEWMPARLLLGASGILFTAALTRAQRD